MARTVARIHGDEPPAPEQANVGKVVQSPGGAEHCEGDDSDGYLYTAPVDSYPQGASPYGVYNMVGNVQEWVSDWWGPWTTGEPQVDPLGPATDTQKVSRGSDCSRPPVPLTYRFTTEPWGGLPFAGIRCAQSANAMPTAVGATGWGPLEKQVGMGR